MTKLIHISDLHMHDFRFSGNMVKATKELVEKIIEQEDPAECVVIISGDLVSSMTGREKISALYALLPLRNAGFRILIAKGNHDHGPLGLILKSSAVDHFRDLVKKVCGHLPDEWPQHIELDDMMIVTMNSSWDQTVLARGRLGVDQIKEAQRLFDRVPDKLHVATFHHCPSSGDPTKRLSDRMKLKEHLECDLMLVGHLHQDREWSNTFGAKLLMSVAPSARENKYRKIWFNENGGVEWVWG